MKSEPCPPGSGDRLRLSGTVVSGARKGAFFTQLDWVRSQCLAQVGFEPFPGTLNIRLAEEDRAPLSRLFHLPGLPLVPPGGRFCSGRVFPVFIGTIPGAIVLPEESVRIHDAGIVEVLAPVSLREQLNLKDGDKVTLEIRL